MTERPAAAERQRPTDQPVPAVHSRPGNAGPEPYLQRRGEHGIPEGWVAEPARAPWQGEDVEVVYDPSRHDVAFYWEGPRSRRGPTLDVLHDHRGQQLTLIAHSHPDEDWKRALEALGWQQRAVDGGLGFWARDRSAVARAALERSKDADPGAHQAGPQAQDRAGHRPHASNGELTI